MSIKKRESIFPNVEALPKDDVVDEYGKLADLYTSMKQELDKCRQELHHQKLQTKMLTSTQDDLQNELDSISSTHKIELSDFKAKSNAIVEGLKEKTRELAIEKAQLESVVEELSKQIVDSQKINDDLQFELDHRKPATRYSDASTIHLEAEVENLQLTISEMKLSSRGKDELIKEQRSSLDEIKERLMCLEDNLSSKKSEVQEKNEMIESLQDKIQETTIEIALLKSAPDDSNRKGNSLFAEVDDQRQKMKTVLQGERAHYLDMKKTCNAKEIEIRRLKRENMNIKKEIQACSSLLHRGEQIFTETMSAEINKLRSDNTNLEGRLKISEQRLIDLAGALKLEWVDSILSTSSMETSKLRSEQMTLRMQKTSLAENLQKNQKDLAKVRLDCVKLKILLSRIVEANNIKINEKDFIDIDLDNEVLEGIKVEEFETLEETNSDGTSDVEMFNESSIVLLGERERLTNSISSVKTSPEQTIEDKVNSISSVKTSSGQSIEDKENSTSIKTPINSYHQMPVTPLQPRQMHKLSPLKGLQIAIQSPTKPQRSQNFGTEKSVKFSNEIKTEIIDNNQEQFDQSKQARKRPGLIVKRIIIPSKPSAK